MSSCLVKQFQHYADLSDREIELLQALEKDRKSIPKDQLVRDMNDPADYLYTVSSGWMMSYKVLSNGNRQVVDFLLPGQIAGLDDVAFKHASSALLMVTDGDICPFPKQNLHIIFNESPRLTDLFYMMMSREHALRSERIVNMGAKDSLAKLAHFIIEITIRVGRVMDEPSDEINLPVTQEVIGQALGITPIHVNRCLAMLREAGYINQHRNKIKILRYDDLCEVAEFDEAYLAEDLSWIRTHA